MADLTARTIGFVCPHCRQNVITVRTPFQLTASASCEIPCPCGKSSLRVEYLLDRFRVTAPCSVCGGDHSVTCPAEAFLSRKALAFSCPSSGVDCCYVGEEGPVFAAMERLERALDGLKKEKENGSGTFLNELVMQEVLGELRDIAAEIVAGGQLGFIPEQAQLFRLLAVAGAFRRNIRLQQLLQLFGDRLVRGKMPVGNKRIVFQIHRCAPLIFLI